MPSEPYWLNFDQAVEYNRLAVGLTGEPFFVRDPAMLEGALASPKNHWAFGGERKIAALAATLIGSIARGHPFAQGNKRAALLCARGFLELNGFELRAPDDLCADFIIGMIERRVSNDAFSAFITDHVAASPKPVRLRNSRRRLRR